MASIGHSTLRHTTARSELLSLRGSARWIRRLSGVLARKGDREPGMNEHAVARDPRGRRLQVRELPLLRQYGMILITTTWRLTLPLQSPSRLVGNA